MGKYALIVVAGFILTFGYVKRNLDRADANLADNYAAKFEQHEAKMAAHALANMVLATLADSTNWRTGFSNVSIGGGTGWATLEDNSTDTTLAVGEVRITTGGGSGATQDTVIVLVTLATGLPPGVHGSVTANSVVKTLGSMIVDGRDHDTNGNLLIGQGTMGISTTQTYTRSGNSKTGGTDGGVDYTPSKPANAAIIEENAAYAFPTNPDDVFGYAAGTLKGVAQSGANGSQYVTNPSSLTFPLSGVTYVELPNGGTWQSMNFGASTGVLVVHNSWTNAVIKTLNHGTFTGLLIADDIDKIHTDIIGAVVSLTTSPSGNCIGNGNGSVLYSRTALEQASAISMGGSGAVTVSYWLE